ncbi:MAG: hypothetical protein V3T08_05360 [Gemmatimonadota bacterium]
MTDEETFDVIIEGARAERGARVLTARDGLHVNQHEIPYETLLGVALRGSILLVVGTQVAMALRGSRDGLATLAAELRRNADLEHLPSEERKRLEGERVVFATPVAMSGRVSRRRIKGMPLAVVTDKALHVLDRGGQQFRLAWDSITRLDLTEAKFGRLLRVSSGSAELEFMYLTDAQIQTIRGLAARHSRGMLGLGAGEKTEGRPGGGPETAGDVASALGTGGGPRAGTAPAEPPGAGVAASAGGAPPVSPPQAASAPDAGSGAPSPPGSAAGIPAADAMPVVSEEQDLTRHFTVPEFEMSLGGVGSGSDRPLGTTINKLQMSPVLPVGFLEEHLREIRTVYEGALVKAKREAAAAEELDGAAQALDGRRLWEGVVDSVGVIAKATIRAFERQARHVAANRRIPWRRAQSKYMPDPKQITGLKQRLLRGVAALQAALTGVTRAAGELRRAGERGRAELESAYAQWLNSLRELDRIYAEGWSSVSREIVGVWEKAFLPSLTELAGERRRLLAPPVRVALYVLVAALVAVGVYLSLTGQLQGFVPLG